MSTIDLLCKISERGARYDKIEDRFEIVNFKNLKISAIYDGHSGSEISDGLSKSFCRVVYNNIINSKGKESISNILRESFLKKDRLMYDANRKCKKYGESGSTCIMSIFIPSKNSIFFANLGDSRAVLFKVEKFLNSTLITKCAHTIDHKPSRNCEKNRIIAAGGYVSPSTTESVPRVDGILAVSRGFGDFCLKKSKGKPYDSTNGKVCAVPTITKHNLDPKSEYILIMASDGLWDEVNMVELQDYLQKSIFEDENKSEKMICEDLLNIVRAKGGDDDVTILTYKIKTN